LVYADDVNLLCDDIETIRENTLTLIDAGKEVGLEVDAEKTKYMLLSRQQNARQNHDINIGNRCFENVGSVQIFWNDYNKSKPDSGGNKWKLISGNACFHSVQILLCSRLLSKDIKIRIKTF
jgi:hypothetical protein